MIPDSPTHPTSAISPGALLQVTALRRRYGARQVVCDITFSVRRGQVVGLLGPNGAGKSSIMKIISGILPPSEGKISIEGLDMMKAPLAARSHIGFLPEQPPIYDDMTVDEYLHFCAAVRRVPRADIGRAVADAKTAAALTDVGGRLTGNLSKGYRQRLGIAQAIVHNPSLLVLDEPTAGLDPVQINETRTLIKHLSETRGVILSTHILTEAQQICDQVLIIHQGRIILSRSMEEGGETGYITRFLNPPTEAELAKKLQREVQRLDDGRFLVRCRNEEEISGRLVPISVEQGWGLTELTPETDALESIFLQLTQTEAP